jgi:DMSO/TMAO reductase YedYZ molybdopterin-dependent catalytic subunit
MSDDRGVSPEMSRAEQAPVTSPGPVHDQPWDPTSGEGRPGGGSGDGSGEWPVDPSRKMLALAGVIAGAAGIALSQAAAGALRVESSPVEAVAAAVRDFTPGPIAVFLVHLVGSADKPLLLGGTAVAVLGMCGYAASLMRRHPLLPDLVFFALTVVGLAAILRLPSPGIGSALALMVGLVTWIVTLRVLTAPLLGEVVGDHTPDLRRRDFMIRSGWVVAAVAVLTIGGRFAGSGRRHAEQARRLLRLPVRHGEVPVGADLGVPGIQPWRTSNSDFYLIHTALAPPSISPPDWQLRIHGMVERELTFSYQDLIDRQLTEAWITLCCVSNEVGGDLIGNAYWSGVLARELLAEAGVKPGADAVLQTSRDGWNCGTPLSALTDDRNAMLAVAMNGKPLPVEHGFPVRMVVPGLYGYVSATKWLVDLEVTRFDKFQAYWTERSWSEKGPVKTQSRIDVPGDGAQVNAGSVPIGGSAWAQHTGIEKVEYQLDGAAWAEADLGRVPQTDTWVQWSARVDVDPGDHVLVVRATDRSGYTQTSVRADVVPDGATGWDSVTFDAS